MSKHAIRTAALALGLGLLLAVAADGAENHTFVVGNLVIHDYGGITPRKLPRHEQAPITGHLNARLGTLDGTHPPAVQSLVIDFDRTLQVNATGLPACKRSQLTAQSTAAAQRACPDSIVGSGDGEVEVEFPEQKPFSAKGKVLAFNGGVRGGKTILFVHTYVDVPAPTAVVAKVTMTHVHQGRYALHTVTEIPRIAGGAGSVTAFKLNLGRRFAWHGHKKSYLTASCPTGRYYIVGRAHFSDGTTVHLSHELPCTPMR
jgi:hypothetical protein